jgi:alkanesulfonate monooxygenase SsuD/methylene tetrahydromethanopterin reductase-like flavin-dependent oxidoreductase (luciferase family)
MSAHPITVGYWLSSEEHDPRMLVDQARQAEAAGFTAATISDHFHPWIRAQGQSGFVWAVLGGIAAATERLRVATGVTAPIIRLHPAIVAHAAATVATMFDGRWPGATERRAMLEEAVTIIRRLFEGGNVNHQGTYYRVENAELFTRPVVAPPVYLAVGGPKSAEQAGRLGDGMIAVSPDPRSVEAFEAAGGAGKPRIGQLHVCWAATVEEARCVAHRFWPNAAVKGQALVDLARPQDFEKVVEPLGPEVTTAELVLGPDADRHVDAITRFAAAGFTEVHVHQVGPAQSEFIEFYAGDVLPRFAP